MRHSRHGGDRPDGAACERAWPEEKIPAWFDQTLRADLDRKIHRSRRGLYFLDPLILGALQARTKDPAWRYRRPYTWKELEAFIADDCGEIAGSGFHPDLVVGLKSGGAFIAKYVADCLAVDRVAYVDVTRYPPFLGSAVLGFAIRFLSPTNLKRANDMVVENREVLLVDDQARTGRSLRAVAGWLGEHRAAAVRTYCVFTQGAAKTDYGGRRGIMMISPWGDDP